MVHARRWDGRTPWTLVAVLAMSGCAGGEGPPAVTDPPRRIVSFVPAATEVIVRLGAADLLVARTSSDAGEALRELPVVGDVLTPNVERLAAIQPDLILVWSESPAAPFERTLAPGGRLERVAVERLSDVATLVEDVAAWIERPGDAVPLLGEFEATLSALEPRPDPPSVLWVVWPDPITVAGPGSFVDDVLAVAGGRNALAHLESPWPQISAEALLRLDPDVLVWPRADGVFAIAELARRRPWSLLRAVEEDRVLSVESERYHVPGIHLGEAALDLATSLRALETQ